MMKRAKLWLTAAALCLCLIPVQVQAQTLPITAYRLDAQSRHGVADTVFTLYGADGTPIPFTRQCGVWRSGGSETRLSTDTQGRLVLCGLESGTYQLQQKSSPKLYRRLRKPIQLTIDGNGALTVEGHTCREVSILHRSGKDAAAKAAVVLCSAMPATVRLGLLWWKKGCTF